LWAMLPPDRRRCSSRNWLSGLEGRETELWLVLGGRGRDVGSYRCSQMVTWRGRSRPAASAETTEAYSGGSHAATGVEDGIDHRGAASAPTPRAWASKRPPDGSVRCPPSLFPRDPLWRGPIARSPTGCAPRSAASA